MISLLLVLVLICTLGVQIKKNGIHNDYMSRTQTIAIRGIFACIIFASHLRGYITLSNVGDQIYDYILSLIGQCMVSVFFFYSGYGIMSGYKNKEKYEQSFLQKRLFFTWFHFAVAVVLYDVMNLFLNIRYPLQIQVLSFTGWETIGNSNWFMFDTFLLYIIVWISFKLLSFISKNAEEKQKYFSMIVAILTGIMIVILHLVKESWWYDTLLCFPFGILYSRYQEKIDKSLKNCKKYLIIGVFSVFLFVAFYRMGNFLSYNVCACFFVFVITWFSMKVKVENKILNWLGKNSFYIYIYMRIPMIMLSQVQFFSEHRYIFTVFSLIATIFLSWIMSYVQKQLDIKIQQIINRERK